MTQWARVKADPTAGEKVLVLYASASFGYGRQGCAGRGLARIEAHSVLESLARHVNTIEVLGTERVLNNVIRAFQSVRVVVTAADMS